MLLIAYMIRNFAVSETVSNRNSVSVDNINNVHYQYSTARGCSSVVGVHLNVRYSCLT